MDLQQMFQFNTTPADYQNEASIIFGAGLNLTIPEEEDDNMSEKTRQKVTYYLGMCSLVLCCFGLVGNTLSAIVLTRKPMRSSTYSYLCGLSVCDFLVVLFSLLLVMYDVRTDQDSWYAKIYPYMFPWVHPAAFTFQVTSVWLTLAFTVDRYIMICHPFKAEPYCTISRARKVIVALYFFGICFNMPKFFEYTTKTHRLELPYRNLTIVYWAPTEMGNSPVFRQLYHSYFYILFVCGVPFLALAILNGFLMAAVHMSNKKGKEINAVDRKRNDTTIMLIGVIVIFFVCQTPALVSRAIWAGTKLEKFKRLPFFILNETGNMLVILNSAINVVPYYFFGRKFRKQFWMLFCRCVIDQRRISFSQTFQDSAKLNIAMRRISQPTPSNNAHDENRRVSRLSNNTCLSLEMDGSKRDSVSGGANDGLTASGGGGCVENGGLGVAKKTPNGTCASNARSESSLLLPK